MGLNNSNKIISADRIDCSGSLKVTLALSASPDITENPTDIVLILDRSGSMAGSPLENLKAGAKKFIDIIVNVFSIYRTMVYILKYNLTQLLDKKWVSFCNIRYCIDSLIRIIYIHLLCGNFDGTFRLFPI